MLTRITSTPAALLAKVIGSVRSVEMPTLTRDADIDVYLVHNSLDPEDYFFQFDFEQFMERSKRGLFVRPRLRIWAGRSDFDRRRFARQFREVFAREFEAMRRQNGQGKSWGWIDFGSTLLFPVALVSTIVVNLVLLAALGLDTDKRKRRRARQIEAEVEETKERVEDALSRITITLHRELYSYAYRSGTPGKLTGMDYEAWPLPAYVRAHMQDGESSSWW
ncbi:hypothetical protein FHS89_002810 [Rubricella aquisinus]|uniref:Uncharacterized protein n=1 Tax=Rubricella aquisinus TaxID=2028108 RepID=A0A840WNY3_9RHOB|nr:hypothetical protein [Rubricella aquisinus]MBB5516768.1 hypothetical protein [Rubricella aquisinus]